MFDPEEEEYQYGDEDPDYDPDIDGYPGDFGDDHW